ncbi:MAG: transposase [Gammaproteobacteria bacterium]
MDAHASSCTLAMIGPSGKRLGSQVVETNAKALIEAIRTIPGRRHLCLEEGTLASWLHEVLSPHVEELVVAAVNESRGPKSDQRDAFGLAEALRIGALKRQVYKERGPFGTLGYRAKAHRHLVSDAVRVMTRIKSLLRSRGVVVSGRTVYAPSGRTEWLRRLPPEARPAAELLYLELDALSALREQAEKELLIEARKHRAYRIVKSCPGLGPIRAAELLPIVVTPYRFANKRGFWSYCGLGIVTRSSSDWVRTRSGQWMKAPVQQTRGLNRNFNRALKRIFKGAATTVISRAEQEPLYRHYAKLLDGGTKPNLAKLTLARQIASIALSLWRNEEEYDPTRLEMAVMQIGA